MIILFLIAVLLAIIKGAYDGIRDGLKGVNKYAPVEEVQEIPYYIDEQIEAISYQIHTIHQLIKRIDDKLSTERNIDEITILEKKKADQLYKVAKLEEKLQKLLEKWD